MPIISSKARDIYKRIANCNLANNPIEDIFYSTIHNTPIRQIVEYTVAIILSSIFPLEKHHQFWTEFNNSRWNYGPNGQERAYGAFCDQEREFMCKDDHSLWLHKRRGFSVKFSERIYRDSGWSDIRNIPLIIFSKVSSQHSFDENLHVKGFVWLCLSFLKLQSRDIPEKMFRFVPYHRTSKTEVFSPFSLEESSKKSVFLLWLG